MLYSVHKLIERGEVFIVITKDTTNPVIDEIDELDVALDEEIGLDYDSNEEKELLTEQEKKDLSEENFSLAFYVVKKFQNSGVAYDELVSIAMVGFAKALNAYDKKRQVKFSTYAINCIRNEILFFMRKEKAQIRNNVSLSSVISVDKNGNSLCLEETIKNSDSTFQLEDDILLKEDINTLREALRYLSPKESYIITYRFGLNRGIVKTQKEIADDINMSQANVSKLEKNILDKLRAVLQDDYTEL